MRAHIKKLQSKSEDTRKLIFLGTMVVSMSFVSFVWIYGLGVRFGNPEVKVQADEDIKPFKMFGDSVSSTLKNVSASVGSINMKKDLPSNTEKQIDLIPIDNTSQTSDNQIDLTPTDNTNQTQNEQIDLNSISTNTIQIPDKQIDLTPTDNTKQ